MRWPWKRVEKRNYSSTILAALEAAADASGDPTPLTSAAVEIAAGFWGRAFAMADVTGADKYFSPELLAWIGRAMVRHGEALMLIEPDDEALMPLSCDTSIEGGPMETEWTYRVTMHGPTTQTDMTVASERVVHCRYAFEEKEPWRGLAPIAFASQTGALAAGLERTLKWEANGNLGYLLPVPQDVTGGDDDTDPLATLRSTLKDLKGKTAILESTRSMAPSMGSAPPSDWKPQRLGANPPETLVELRYAALASLLAVMGVSPALAGVTNTAVAPAASREAWRQFLHGTVQPAARLVAAEASRKLGIDVEFNFDRLFASDLQGRARAFQSMVTGGMDVTKAASLSGLLAADA